MYANTHKTYLTDLITLNNKLLRIVQKKDMKSHVLGLYNDYFTMPIDLLHKSKVLILMHKFLHLRESLPLAFSNYFLLNSSVHAHNTRSSSDFHVDANQTRFDVRSVESCRASTLELFASLY